MAEQITFHEQNEGWKHEFIHNDQCVVIERPREIGGGFVTVDLERRIFACGYGWVSQHAGAQAYSGAGWKNRIIRDAIDHLESMMR